MSIKVIHNKKLDLKIPEFSCDGSLNENLEKYPMLQNLNGFKFTIIIGKPGMGKTSMLTSWLTGKSENKIFRKVFDNVVAVMPTTSRASMKKNIFKNHPDEKLFDELNNSSISAITFMLEDASKDKKTTLLILDDVGASLKQNSIQTQLKKIIYNRRHLKVHIILLLQSFISCPREVRKLVNNVVMFKPSKTEAIALFDELFETNKDDTMKLMRFAYKDPHDYLFLNVSNQRIFQNYDEIILKNNNLDYDIDDSEDS